MTTASPWKRRVTGALLATAIPFLSGCDEGVLEPPDAADPMFHRYVAIGNSITAGFQSAGINEATQEESYAVILAEQMETDFAIPAFAPPGCPPPLTDLLTGERAGGAEPTDCALRSSPAPDVLHNVAVPEATPLDVFDNLAPESRPNPLTVLILGGRTQAEAARAAEPTFVTVWVGNNDALGVATSGSVSEETLTPLEAFEDRYATMLDELGEEMEGVLVGVAHPVFVPYLSFGPVYWELQEAGQLPENLQVDESCSADPDEGGLGLSYVPFNHGIEARLLPALEDEDLELTLDCEEDEEVLRPDELDEVTARVNAYNDVVAAEAEARGWAFLDPNVPLQQLDEAGLIPPFPNFQDPPRPFGPLFSLDGIHPSGSFHHIAAERLVEAINDHYGTELPPPDPSMPAADPSPDAHLQAPPDPLRRLEPMNPEERRWEAAGMDGGGTP